MRKSYPYLSLLLWILPLLLFNSGENSLMAHDEGLYARRSRVMFESGDWIAPWGTVHHKTPGPYWLIAISYQLFGISEFSIRLPSMITGILCLLLIYEIGKITLNQNIAWLAGLILTVQFLWLQYCRLGTPDVPMIFLVLLAIFAFLQGELHPKYRYLWSFIAGLSLGLGFLVRSFMIFLPIVALLPYLIGEHRRHHHLTQPSLYFGFVVGLIPTSVWLWLNWMRYGNDSYQALFRFVLELGSDERGGNGIIFYLWNVPLKSFPWFLFSVFGLVLLLRRPIPRYQLILVGFPLTLFVELSIFSTRLSHYSLCLYPFIALLAAVGLSELGKWGDRKIKKVAGYLSYGCGGLGVLLVLAGIIILIGVVDDVEIRQYATLGLIMGCGWLMLPLVWIGRYQFQYWLAGWLIPCWLTLAVAGGFGLFSDYNPEVRVFLQQPAIASILQSHPIYFVQVEGKTGVLLNFYTPVHGKQVNSITELPPSTYAWISATQEAESTTPHQVIGTVQNHQLIRTSGE
ncbi:glycosyltransferase family 39 protein [Nodularia harveyana UHCC-0300]|uniref:Glycosyltransferase family 39 protein n=1 Tax=Nodularia harveyana UHCC-0300 TaxID=2974287 RepID=A0ABU5U9W1_9CYAN|nr:glycosyltransferase family 39 protein [Nodularia harveyana]MEA5580307.1 glycosyltransferase family 39 protein [Nodularia harveyana UHCC-0300]